MDQIASNYEENIRWFDEVLGAGRSCDIVYRDLYVAGRRARFWVIDGFGGDAILERMGAFWLSLPPEAVRDLAEMQQFADRFVTFMEVNVSFDRDDIVTSVLMGKSLLLVVCGGVAFYCALQNLDVVWGAVRWLLGILALATLLHPEIHRVCEVIP